MDAKHLMVLMAAALTGVALAEVKLGTPFADGMVLQRDAEVAVWGTAESGEKITVTFAGNAVSANADGDGRWLLRLPKMSASREGRPLEVVDASGRNTVLSDVLVGEVWFCCGQSNSEMPLVGDDPHFGDRQGRLVAQMTRKPLIRYVYASDYRWSETPRSVADYPVVWKQFQPENLGEKPSFSAMGVYFALELYSELEIPIGIVGSYWGGTNIDPWIPRSGYEGKEGLRPEAEWKTVPQAEWNKEVHPHGAIISAHKQPTVLWNEMVAPWCPMTMRGFLWYQGCSNADEGTRYCEKMHALYDGWVKEFRDPNLKIYFAQLAPYHRSWWDLQLSQARFAAEEPNAAMITTGDIGNFSDIHPNEKGTVGKRLAALALSREYGFRDIHAEPPVLNKVVRDGHRLVLSFDNAPGWYLYDREWKVDSQFELADAEGVWHKAALVNCNDYGKEGREWETRGKVQGTELVLEAEGVERPVKVRYLHESPFVSVMFTDNGIPLGPFEADCP